MNKDLTISTEEMTGNLGRGLEAMNDKEVQAIEKSSIQTFDVEETVSEKDFDFSGFTPVKSKASLGKSVEAGVLSVINTKKHGKRIRFPQSFHKELGTPESLQINLSENAIAIGELLPENDTDFWLRNDGKSKVIYSSSLVDEITEHFNLDFSNKTSITFHEAEYITIDECKVAIVKVN